MGNLTITNKILDKYFKYLLNLDNSTKKKLIIKLTKSLDFKEVKKDNHIKSLFGAWKDDKSAEEIINDIRKSRVEPIDKSF